MEVVSSQSRVTLKCEEVVLEMFKLLKHSPGTVLLGKNLSAEESEVPVIAVFTCDAGKKTSVDHNDEPHGSLFVYFRIFAPLADDHVIVSHVTSVTRPIPTFSNQL
jgi:hypothetical protein